MSRPAFGELLRRHRTERGLSQAGLAERADLHQETVRELERGEKQPRPVTVDLLAKALGLDEGQRDALRAAASGRRAAAGREAPRPRGRLRHPADSFVGREPEVAAVCARLAAHRLVTLTGVGGVGKTRLAVEAAHQLAGPGGGSSGATSAFPDGVWLVGLAGLGAPELVPGAVAAAVGVELDTDGPPAEALADALGPRRLLLLLDNCEHLVDACATVAEALLGVCPAVHLLATSREPLGCAGETIYRVPSLALPPVAAGTPEAIGAAGAVRLFVDRAAAGGAGFALTARNAPAVAEICRRLDGLPLALELAAQQVRLLPAEALVARLDDRFRLLTGGRRTALERQQTLRATVDSGYALLTPAEQALFVRLCVFARTFTLEAAEAVCGGPGPAPPRGGKGSGAEANVLAPLLRLVDTSFVLVDAAEGVGPERHNGATLYRLLETLREYGRERFVADPEGTARLWDRHLAYHLGLVEAAAVAPDGMPLTEALKRLEAARDDLWAALAWVRDREDAGADRRLGAALARLTDRLAVPEVRHALAPLLAELRRLELSAYAGLKRRLLEHTASEVLAGGVDLYWIVGDHEAQAAVLRRLQDVEQEPGAADRVQLRRARWLLLQHSVREALALLTEVRHAAEARGDDALRLDALLEEGYAHTHTGDCAQGQRAYEEALALLERLRPGLSDRDYRERRLVAVRGRGFVAHNADDNETCAACHREVGTLAQALGDRPEVVRAWLNLADAQWGCGDLSGALRTYGEALEASDTAYYAMVRFGCLTGRGIVLESIGRTEEAVGALREGLGLARDLGDAWWIAYGLAHLSAALAAQGDLEAALDASREAVAVALRHGVGYPLALARAHALWQQEVLAPGHPEHATPIEEALREAEALGLRGLGVYLAWVRLLHRAADPAVPDPVLERELAAGLQLYRERAPVKGPWEALGRQVGGVLVERRPRVDRAGLDSLIDEVVERKAASLAPDERQEYRDSRRGWAPRSAVWSGR